MILSSKPELKSKFTVDIHYADIIKSDMINVINKPDCDFQN